MAVGRKEPDRFGQRVARGGVVVPQELEMGVPACEAIFRSTGFPRLGRLAAGIRLAPLSNRLNARVARNRYRLPRPVLARLLALASRRNARAS